MTREERGRKIKQRGIKESTPKRKNSQIKTIRDKTKQKGKTKKQNKIEEKIRLTVKDSSVSPSLSGQKFKPGTLYPLTWRIVWISGSFINDMKGPVSQIEKKKRR